MRHLRSTDAPVAYTRLRQGDVARTVQVTASALADLDSNDRIVGIETLDGQDWAGVIATLAMAGRLAVPERGNLWPETEHPVTLWPVRPNPRMRRTDLRKVTISHRRISGVTWARPSLPLATSG